MQFSPQQTKAIDAARYRKALALLPKRLHPARDGIVVLGRHLGASEAACVVAAALRPIVSAKIDALQKQGERHDRA